MSDAGVVVDDLAGRAAFHSSRPSHSAGPLESRSPRHSRRRPGYALRLFACTSRASPSRQGGGLILMNVRDWCIGRCRPPRGGVAQRCGSANDTRRWIGWASSGHAVGPSLVHRRSVVARPDDSIADAESVRFHLGRVRDIQAATSTARSIRGAANAVVSCYDNEVSCGETAEPSKGPHLTAGELVL